MGRTLAKDRGKAVVVRVFVVLDGADSTEELIRTAVIDISNRTTRLGRIVIEIAVKMDRMRSEVLQLGAGSPPQFLSPGQIPLVELLRRGMRGHGDRTYIGPGNARYRRTGAGAWSGIDQSQEVGRLTVVRDGGGKRIILRRQSVRIEL